MIKVSITFFLLFVYFSNLSKAVKICTGFSWDFPFGLFLQNPLPEQEKCIAVTVLNVNEYSTLSRCSTKSKMKVFVKSVFKFLVK
ncbi:hypothetical protein Avbf_18588 [Armadillidium vulgare]|nr:hypothetical protein Avbf_18588 [Armadillidium vulgare]